MPCPYTECRILFTFMLNVIMLSVIMLNVVMLSVVMLNVVMLRVVMLNVIQVPAEYFQPILAFVDWAGVFIYSTIRRSKPDPQIDLGLYCETFYGRN
jgi:hypothetical protein